MIKESELNQAEETKKTENTCSCGCGCMNTNAESLDTETTNKEDVSS